MAAFNYFDYQVYNNIIKDRMMWTQLYYIFDLKYDRKALRDYCEEPFIKTTK